MAEKSKYQAELESLPEWAQQMVRAVAGCGMYGAGHEDALLGGMGSEHRRDYRTFFVALHRDRADEWFDGFYGLRDLAAALTAPFPAPSDLPPHEAMRTNNLVEMATAGDDDCAFDQPCYFGHRVETHAVYCHNDKWPDGPRKCRRNRDDFKHEDCPGYVKNSAYVEVP